MSEERVCPFYNSAHAGDWTTQCEACKKRKDCEIFKALVHAYFTDGTVSEEIARRMGYYDNIDRYLWICPEFEHDI